LGLTGFPIKKKIKAKNSIEQIRVGLQSLSNCLDSTFCPYTEDYLNNINLDSINTIETYGEQLNTLIRYKDKLMELLGFIFKCFYSQDNNAVALLHNDYSFFINSYSPSSQLPQIHKLFKKDPVLTYYLILIIRKGYILLTELGFIAFIELIKDIMCDPSLPSSLLFSFKKYIEASVVLPKLTEKLNSALNIIATKKAPNSTSSLMLFVKEKIVCAYLHNLLKQTSLNLTFNCIYKKKGASTVIFYDNHRNCHNPLKILKES
jgi:hypothetical protein